MAMTSWTTCNEYLHVGPSSFKLSNAHAPVVPRVAQSCGLEDISVLLRVSTYWKSGRSNTINYIKTTFQVWIHFIAAYNGYDNKITNTYEKQTKWKLNLPGTYTVPISFRYEINLNISHSLHWDGNNQMHKSHNAHVPYPTMHNSERNYAHFCSEWCIMVYGAVPLWNLWDWIISWWRHRMETFSALLALCEGNSPVTGEFPSQRPVTRRFDVLFDLNKRLSKQSRHRWFKTPSRWSWRHCNVYLQRRGWARHLGPGWSAHAGCPRADSDPRHTAGVAASPAQSD